MAQAPSGGLRSSKQMSEPKCNHHSHDLQDELKAAPGDSFVKNIKSFWIVVPFIFLFLFKEAVSHSTGLWVLISLIVSSSYLNTRLVSATNGFEPPVYALVASILVCATVIFMHHIWIFRKSEIYLGLFCWPNGIPSDDWVSLLWAVIVVDLSLKIITILIKAVIVFLTPRFFYISTRSAVLVWIEFIAQFYRNIPPAVTWVRHLTGGTTGSIGFQIFFCLVYIIFKLVAIAVVGFSMRPIFKSSTFSLPYQTNVVNSSGEQELCNLCFENRGKDVAILGCNHTFCRGCVDRWLMHYNECPLCSHSLGETFRSWSDGSTSALVYFF